LLFLQNVVLSTIRQTSKLPFGTVLLLLYLTCITVVIFVFLDLMLYIAFIACTVCVILCCYMA